MSKTIVSILSDHLLPNFLFIKEMEGLYSDLLFMSTPQMEMQEKAMHLEVALGRKEGSVRRIVVANDNYKEILDALRAEQLSDSVEYVVNITGGTKTMSLAVHEYFCQFNASFVYVPIGKNSYYDFSTDQTHSLDYRVSLNEYFTLYGLAYDYDNDLICDAQRPFNLFNEQKMSNFYLTEELRFAHKAPRPELRRYLGGEWFEEYVYLRIKRDFKLRDEDIAKSVKICRLSSTSNDNELDVVFVKDNALYVIECKVSMTGYGKEPKSVVDEYLYKLAAISKDFGLRVNSYIFTLHQMWRFAKATQENMSKRMRILGIRDIIDGPKLTQPLKL
ncbi:Card1-like endonuclease domain-containing protein [uncultured Porphyromonas sp.]|uniref:Card1-like endonuclease domain-containing protein n=1 Tax=uncultured Porphyromonas sp. TaxID=159274 RepID=UPI0028042206|nr:DUF1887 family CARF protein [uncultured Porphyromonas sp.]